MELNSIRNEDCFTTLSHLPNDSVDLIVSSPPYNIGKEYEKQVGLDEYLSNQGKLFKEMYRVLKPSGSVFWQVGIYVNGHFHVPLDIATYPWFCEAGFNPVNRVVWVRQHGLHSKRRFSGRHETIMWYSKSSSYKFNLDGVRVPQKYQGKTSHRGSNKGKLSCNPLGKNPGDVWAFSNVKHNHEEQTIHPCQFPEDLIARIILSTTDTGDLVYDPYIGSGTVAVVAKENGRDYLGSEMVKSYCEVSERRVSGLPNELNSFANLKCLRSYCRSNNLSPEGFTFDINLKRKTPTLGAKVKSEDGNFDGIMSRLGMEEDFFGDRLRGLNPDPTRLANSSHSQGLPK
jgi:adenine-specific DNA-methyltransferase